MNHLSNDEIMPTPSEVFERLQSATLNADPDAQAELYADNIVMEFPFALPGTPRRNEGRSEIYKQTVAGMKKAKEMGIQLTGYQSVKVYELADPEVIIVEFELAGKVGASGAHFKRPYIQVIRVQNGKIVSLREYYSPETAEAIKMITAEA